MFSTKMVINTLKLINFKNHPERYFEFSPQLNCFVGNNGVGKTNVLDALHYLSVGKSFLGNTDANNITSGQDFFTLEASVAGADRETLIKIQQPREGKKIIKKNDKPYDRLSEHIGFLPGVIISPYDSNLISDSGESRRRFLDAMISQTDPEYLFDLIQYQKTLQQRNALLKNFARHRYFDAENLEIYDAPLVKFGAKLHDKRGNFTAAILPLIRQYYEKISGAKEMVTIEYESHLNDGAAGDAQNIFQNLLQENLEKDRALTYTSKGVHKDDLLFSMDGLPLKRTASQGQQKSFLIALKLSQMHRIKATTGKTPILLLDDIFDKLDDLRVAQLIDLVHREHFGQIFITDTHAGRTEELVKKISEDARLFRL